MHIFYEESFQKQCFRYASQKIVDFHFAISNTLQRWTLFENHCGSPILQDFERSELRLFLQMPMLEYARENGLFEFKWDIFDDFLNTVMWDMCQITVEFLNP